MEANIKTLLFNFTQVSLYSHCHFTTDIPPPLLLLQATLRTIACEPMAGEKAWDKYKELSCCYSSHSFFLPSYTFLMLWCWSSMDPGVRLALIHVQGAQVHVWECALHLSMGCSPSGVVTVPPWSISSSSDLVVPSFLLPLHLLHFLPIPKHVFTETPPTLPMGSVVACTVSTANLSVSSTGQALTSSHRCHLCSPPIPN